MVWKQAWDHVTHSIYDRKSLRFHDHNKVPDQKREAIWQAQKKLNPCSDDSNTAASTYKRVQRVCAGGDVAAWPYDCVEISKLCLLHCTASLKRTHGQKDLLVAA